MTGNTNAASAQDAAAAAAALQGASLAFSKKKPAPPPANKDNGALTAATTSVGQPRSPMPLKPHATNGSSAANEPETPDGGLSAARAMPLSAAGALSSGQNRLDSKSPSLIAATLAASRSASPSPKPRTPMRKESPVAMSPTTPLGETVDSGSIAPTGSLISMFERAREGDPVKRASPRRRSLEPSADERGDNKLRVSTQLKPTASQHLESPSVAKEPRSTPTTSPGEKSAVPASPTNRLSRQQTIKPARTAQAEKANEKPPMPVAVPESKPKPKPKPRSSTPPRNVSRPASDLPSPKPNVKAKPKLLTPPRIVTNSTPELVSPKPIRASKPRLTEEAPKSPKVVAREANINKTGSSTRETPQSPARSSPHPASRRAPTPPKPRGSQRSVPKQAMSSPPQPQSRVTRQPSMDSISSNDTFVSASSVQSPERRPSPPPPRRRQPAASAPSSPIRETSRAPRPTNASSSNLPIDSLASAIVAGSLASARLTPHSTGSTLAAPALPTRHKSPRLRPTLRRPVSASDDESDRHKKSTLKSFQRGKHSHHEGSRKKWREEITQRERKRYEAVWASNRGLLLTQSHNGTSGQGLEDVSQCVANLVVREIWKRSRLPDDELFEVWDLVDRSRRAMLDRQEFVVGMWLIDQRLRGRKIPTKVSDSVWGSANGVRVIKPKVR